MDKTKSPKCPLFGGSTVVLMPTIHTYNAVVIWSDMLGGVLTGEEPLPWSGPLLPTPISGGRTETGQTSQCCLLPGNIWRPLYCILPLSLITTVSQSSLAISILQHFICIRQIFVFTFHSVYILAEVIGFSIILCLGVGSSCSLFSSCGTPIFSLFTIS